MQYQIINSDSLEYLRSLQDNVFDSIVTDPPYGLHFMGKKWDYDIPSVEIWRECLRVLKPGGHLLSFAGTRTQHRMAMNIEDAGFEIRDMIAWVYGSGFPKSLDVSKAIDKVNGETGRLHKFTAWMRTTGVTARQLDAATGTNMGGHYLTAASQPAIPTPAMWAVIRPMVGDVPEWVDRLVDRIAAEREVVGSAKVPVGHAFAGATYGGDSSGAVVPLTAPATDSARQWQGWGTALKPALEPITIARKPLIGTVAENVQTYGTGAMNIDECRLEARGQQQQGKYEGSNINIVAYRDGEKTYSADLGRWPANFIHDGSEEVIGLFGTAVRFFYCAKASKKDRDEGLEECQEVSAGVRTGRKDGSVGINAYAGATSPARNFHPTVKPTNLMRYLCRLITPPKGTILDPFMGSGSTGKAAKIEGFNFVGVEKEKEYCEIAERRIKGV